MVETLSSVHQTVSNALRQAGFDNPRRQAAELVCGLLKRPLADLYRYPDDPVNDEQAGNLLEAADKRAQGIPLVYLTGRTFFFDRSFIIHPGVLIPRSDSEVLVETALSCLLENRFSVGGNAVKCRAVPDSQADHLLHVSPAGKDAACSNVQSDAWPLAACGFERRGAEQEIKILDLCTGSGCIGISIAAELQKRGFEVSLMMTDIDEAALACAAENITLHQLEQHAMLQKADLFPEQEQAYDLITANPPYIPTGDIGCLSPEVRLHEPLQALDGGEDGLLFYRRLISKAQYYMRSGSLILLEHGWHQADDVIELLKQQACFADLHVCADYGGQERVSGGYMKYLA